MKATFRELIRGMAKPSDIGEACDELGIEQGDRFTITRSAAKPGCCVFCGERVNVNVDCRMESGWSKARSEGGTNALKLREVHPDTWAHQSCIERIKHGVAPGQEALV